MRKVIKECCGIELLVNDDENLAGYCKTINYDESDESYSIRCPICGKKHYIDKTDLKGFIPEDN